MDRLLTVQELSEYLQIKPSTIYKKTCARQMPFTKIGGYLRFSRTKIDEWLEEQSFDPNASN